MTKDAETKYKRGEIRKRIQQGRDAIRKYDDLAETFLKPPPLTPAQKEKLQEIRQTRDRYRRQVARSKRQLARLDKKS